VVAPDLGTGGELPAEDDDAGTLALDPDYVLPTRVAHWAREDPDRVFLQDVDGPQLSYGRTWDCVQRVARRLVDAGFGPGDRVVTMLPAAVDAAVVWMALGCLGAIEVPIDPGMRGTFLTHVLGAARSRLAIVRPEFVELLRAADVDGLAVTPLERGATTRPPENDVPDTVGPVLQLPRPEDPACVIFTSGTTGLPKGVVLSWAQFSASIGRIPRSWLSQDDCAYCSHPMFHVTGRTPLLSMADVGGRVVFRERFSPSAFLADVRRYGCTTTTAFVALMLATPERPDDADNPLRIVFGHIPALDAQFARRFGARTLGAYGSTEVGFPLLLRERPADPGRRWCGSLRRGYSARVVDEHGAPVAVGAVGELEIRTPARPLALLEYLNDPDATAAAFRNGYYRTGDAVRLHPDGLYEFVDRLRDTLRRHGENISSSAVETVVLADRAVSDCAVLGVPDPVSGQEVVVAVIPRDPETFDPAALHERLTHVLPRSAWPSYIVSLADLPRTPTQKVRKVELAGLLDLATAWRPPGSR
jgi:crotonobetaine/carnitine-CoA ligase